MSVKNEFNLSEDELKYCREINCKNSYESIIVDLKYLFPKIKCWNDIPKNYRLESIYDAFQEAYDTSETLEMCDATEEAFLSKETFKCIIEKKFDQLKNIFEISLTNYYEPILEELFNAEFLEPTLNDEFGDFNNRVKL